MMSYITVSDYILTRLKELNCLHIYGIVGATVPDFYDAIDRFDGVESIVTANELEAGFAADGYGRARGFAASCVSYGPGVQYYLGAITAAKMEKVPMLVVNGGLSQAQREDELQYDVISAHSTRRLTDLTLFSEITIDAIRLDSSMPTDELGVRIDKLLITAVENFGPVYLEIDKTLFNQNIQEPTVPLKTLIRPPSDQGTADMIGATIAHLEAAKAPILLLGMEFLRNPDLIDPLQKVVEKLNIPFITSICGKGILPEAHPLFVGSFESDLAPKKVLAVLEKSDCILSLGCVFGDAQISTIKEIDSKMLRINFGEGRIQGQVIDNVPLTSFLPALFNSVIELQSSSTSYLRPNTLNYSARRGWPKLPREKEFLTHHEILCMLDEFLEKNRDSDFSLVVDVCLSMFPAADLLLGERQNYYCQPIWLSIGWSLAAATGIYQGSGARPIVIIGDGGFHTTAQTLSTISRYNIPSIIILVDNSLYAIEQFLFAPCYFTDPNSEPQAYSNLHSWNYEKLSELFKIQQGGSFFAHTPKELSRLLETAQEDPLGTYIIAAKVPSKDLPPEARQTANDICSA